MKYVLSHGREKKLKGSYGVMCLVLLHVDCWIEHTRCKNLRDAVVEPKKSTIHFHIKLRKNYRGEVSLA